MSTSPTDAPLAIDASLHLIADDLLEGLQLGDLPPCLFHVAGTDDGFELGVKPLEGRHPTELLLGLDAPERWHALGMATGGWASHLRDRHGPPRHRERVAVVTVLSRTGEVVQRNRCDDPDLDALLADADEPAGEQIDLLRLALGLPTDPPPCGSDVYWTIEWLSGLTRQTEAAGTWPDVVALHPAMKLLQASEDGADEDFVEAAAAFARVFDWSRFRRLVADEVVAVPELVPEDATWLDDGAFARFVLTRCPPLSMVRDQAIDHLPADLARHLVDTLDGLGIPRQAWPDLASV